eukprot:166179-Hanusia_phi.AAC.10
MLHDVLGVLLLGEREDRQARAHARRHRAQDAVYDVRQVHPLDGLCLAVEPQALRKRAPPGGSPGRPGPGLRSGQVILQARLGMPARVLRARLVPWGCRPGAHDL